MAVPLSRSSQPVDIWTFGTFGMIEPLRSRVRWDWGGDLFTTFLLLKLDEEAKSGPEDSGRETVTEFEDAPINRRMLGSLVHPDCSKPGTTDCISYSCSVSPSVVRCLLWLRLRAWPAARDGGPKLLTPKSRKKERIGHGKRGEGSWGGGEKAEGGGWVARDLLVGR